MLRDDTAREKGAEVVEASQQERTGRALLGRARTQGYLRVARCLLTRSRTTSVAPEAQGLLPHHTSRRCHEPLLPHNPASSGPYSGSDRRARAWARGLNASYCMTGKQRRCAVGSEITCNPESPTTYSVLMKFLRLLGQHCAQETPDG